MLDSYILNVLSKAFVLISSTHFIMFEENHNYCQTTDLISGRRPMSTACHQGSLTHMSFTVP